MNQDFYSILGISPNAPQDEVIAAFYRLSQKYYPLLESDPAAAEQMNKITEAWRVLSSRRRRAVYDAQQRSARRGIFSRASVGVRGESFGLRHALWQATRDLVQQWAFLTVLTLVLLGAIYAFGQGERQTARAARNEAMRAEYKVELPALPRATSVPSLDQPAHVPTDAEAVPMGPTQIPGETQASPTPLLSPDTATPTETSATALQGATATPTATPTHAAPTSTRPVAIATRILPAATRARPSPTPMPATATSLPGYRYQPPQLLAPASGARYICAHDLILTWSISSGGGLGGDQWFVLEGRQIGSQNWSGMADWTQQPMVVMHPIKQDGTCEMLLLPHGMNEWRVRIIQGDQKTHTIRQFLSDPSDPFVINYAD